MNPKKPNKEIKEPTVRQMRVFSKRYSKLEWEVLCKDKRFVENFANNFLISKKIADNLFGERRRAMASSK